MPLPTALRRPLKLSSRIPGAPALATLALLALAGCSSVGNMFGVVDETKDGGTTLYPCPAVGVLKGTDHVTLVTGAGTDLTDIVAKAEIGKNVQEKMRTLFIRDRQSEPHNKNQNFVERGWQDTQVKYENVMNWSGATSECWLLALKCACFIMNRVAIESLNWRTPFE